MIHIVVFPPGLAQGLLTLLARLLGGSGNKLPDFLIQGLTLVGNVSEYFKPWNSCDFFFFAETYTCQPVFTHIGRTSVKVLLYIAAQNQLNQPQNASEHG